jgi:hypothetical protein
MEPTLEPAAPSGLFLAEFATPHDVLAAAKMVHDAGLTDWDVHSPFPIHGMERAMGERDSPLGWNVLIFALVGVFGALAMMYWMSAIDYPFVAGGKPPGALPPMAPVLFEMGILASAFGAVFVMLHLNRLPRHHHPIFESERFGRASDDGFFLSISIADPKFDFERMRALVERAHATGVEMLEEVGS